MLPGLFELADEHKNSPGMRLSVWAEELTVADQAWDFMGSKPKNTLVVCLNTDDVRGIAPPERFFALNVEWEQALRRTGLSTIAPAPKGILASATSIRAASLCLGWPSPRAVAARSDSAIFPGFCSIPCSVFRDSVVTLIRDLS